MKIYENIRLAILSTALFSVLKTGGDLWIYGFIDRSPDWGEDFRFYYILDALPQGDLSTGGGGISKIDRGVGRE